MKFVHFGDLHVWKLRLPAGDWRLPKSWLGPLNLMMGRAARFPPALRGPAMDAVLAERPDVAVFTGDFTNFSLPQEFAEAAALFAPLHAALGERLFALPGNHDCYSPAAVRQNLLAHYLPWVHRDLVSRLDLTPRLSLIGVHHSEPQWISSNGRVSPEGLAALRQGFAALRTEGRIGLLAGHYPYASPPEHPETKDHGLLGAEDFAEIVRECRPPLYLHGHQHRRWAIRPSLTPDTLCLNCGSLSMRHPDPAKSTGFLSWDQQEDGSLRNPTAHLIRDDGTQKKQPLPIRKLD